MSDIDSWENRVESKLGGIMQAQAVTAQNLDTIYKTLEEIKKDQREAFERIRAIEQEPAQCDTACANKKRVEQLESNQRWGVTTMIGSLFAYVMYHVFGKGTL